MNSKSCGFAGKTIKIKRISGLDPAGNIWVQMLIIKVVGYLISCMLKFIGPLFKNTAASNRLDKTDAL